MVEKKRIFFLLSGVIVFLFLPPAVFGQLVINEIYYDVNGREDGIGNKEKEGDHEWVEIYNAGEEEINLNDWQIKDASGSTCSITKENLSLRKGQFAIIAGYNSTWGFWNIPDDVLKISLGRKIGNGLSNDSDKIILIPPDDGGSVIEMEYKKGAAKEGHSLERIPAVTGDFVEQENPTPGKGVFIVPTLTPTPTLLPSPVLPTKAPTPTPSPSPVLPTATPSPTKMPTPSPRPAKATCQINEVKNEEGEVLKSVKIYIDGQYTHHYAPRVLEFCDTCFCDGDRKVSCGFGEHAIRLEKSGYQNWEETKTIKAGDSCFLNPVMVFSSPTPTPKKEKEESLSPTITSFLLNQNSSPSPFLFLNNFSLLPKKLANKEEKIADDDFGQVLGEQEEKEKKNSGWYFMIGAFYLGTSGWRLYKKGDNDIMEKLDFKEEK